MLIKNTKVLRWGEGRLLNLLFLTRIINLLPHQFRWTNCRCMGGQDHVHLENPLHSDSVIYPGRLGFEVLRQSL